MKKFIKYLSIIAILPAMLLASFYACTGRRDGPKIDKNKTQIYVSAYDGGNGTEWLKEFADEWNLGSDKYQVIIQPEKLSTSNIITAIKSGAQTSLAPTIYYTGEPGFQELIYQDKLEDLTDLTAKKLDGEDGGTLLEKMGTSDSHLDEWNKVASKNGEGMYMLPFSDNFGLMVFDYQEFLDNNFLSYAANDAATKAELDAQGVAYEVLGNKLTLVDYTGDYEYFCYLEGDFILTAGKDGVYGSYDDGQPQTIPEFRNMMNKILSSHPRSKAFIWTSEYASYTDLIVNSIMAQYIGIDEYDTYHNYSGKITVDGVEKNITVDNGYEVYGNDGFKKAAEFVNEFMMPSKYSHSKSLDGAISHTEAQSLFLIAHKAKQENLEFANILVEGEWFEKEASATFKSLEKDGRGMGKREYRILLAPKIEGQKGIDGEGNGSVVSVMNNGSIIVPKQSDKNKLAAIKDFIGYTLKDSSLQRFTTNTGAICSYRYDLTKAQYNTLTPYGKICYQIHHDNENIFLARYASRHQTSFLTISSSKMNGSSLPIRISGGAVPSIIRAFKNVSASSNPVADVVNGAKNFYSAATWAEIVQAARNNGFID